MSSTSRATVVATNVPRVAPPPPALHQQLWNGHLMLVASWTKMMSSSVARDKFLRTMQYGAKALASYLEIRDPKHSMVARLNNTSKSVGDARRAFRLLTTINSWGSLVKAALSPSLSPLSYAIAISRSTSSFLYLWYDNILWAGKAKVIDIDVNHYQYKMYLYLFLSAFIGCIEVILKYSESIAQEASLTKQLRDVERNSLNNSQNDVVTQSKQIRSTLATIHVARFQLFLDFIKNAGDVPSAFEGAFNKGYTSPLFNAFTGFIASLAGWYLSWPV